MEHILPLIQTKLHRPPLPVDLVPRPRLTAQIHNHSLPPLILISAPAGYGKSTLAKSWAEISDFPSAWVSLDDYDDNLVVFLSYLLAALQKISPEIGFETGALLKSSPLPPLQVISATFINELDQINENYLLVLDDYHKIHNPAVHDLIDHVLLHPPASFHLILSTRLDPPLSLARLRAQAKMVEFRADDLRFSMEETRQLFQKMVEFEIDNTTMITLEEQTEGWVTGLRLAALAIQHRIRQDGLHGELPLHNRFVTEYLVIEILTKQDTTLSDCMLKTSILDRFCADLCSVVCFQKTEPLEHNSPSSGSRGEQFLEWLQASNLFVIPLSDDNVWFRYHHLFQDFLYRELERRLSSAEILKLHAAAGSWYGQNGWIEEALSHLLTAGNNTAAIEIVAEHRYPMMNSTQWPRLEWWLNQFSFEIVESSAELWLLKIWLGYHQGQFSEIPALLQHLAAILAQKPDQQVSDSLIGEISSLQSLIAYHTGDFERAISQARQALDLLDPELWIVRVMARMYLGGSLLARGDASGGYQTFYGTLEEEQVQNKRYKATLLMTACNFHWVAADLGSMAQAAKQCIALCETADFQQILWYGNYQLGRVYYQRNNLLEAKELFASVVTRPYQNYGINYTNSACGLGLTYQALGKNLEAQQVAEAAIAFLLETSNTSQLPYALALQAELALMQGNLPTASQWAEKLDPVPPLVPMSGFLAPNLTLVKVWLTQNTPASQGKAAELLSQLQEYFSRTHNNRFLIETLAMQVILEQILGNQSAATEALEKALSLAQPGGFIRIFIDLGPQMANALTQLEVDRELYAYVRQILSAFPKPMQVAGSRSQEVNFEPLTNRELEILNILAERKTNKEIALLLGITPGTVRQHCHNLYQKLGVRTRLEAANRGVELGLLSG